MTPASLYSYLSSTTDRDATGETAVTKEDRPETTDNDMQPYLDALLCAPAAISRAPESSLLDILARIPSASSTHGNTSITLTKETLDNDRESFYL